MNPALLIYIITRFDNIKGLCDFFIIVLFVVFMIFCVKRLFGMENETDEETIQNNKSLFIVFKKYLLYIFLLMLVSVFLPSTKTAYLMTAANYLNKSNLPPKIIEAINVELDNIIKKGDHNNE